MTKPTVGLFGLTGCAGDQLVVLNCEDELLALCELVELRDFLMASSDRDERCALDVAFVEGAVVTEEDERMLRRVRERARHLVALGTCAVWGGIPADPGDAPRRQLLREIYGEASEGWTDRPVRAVRDVVKVDAEITGCPIEKSQLLYALAQLLAGNLPVLASYPVCAECRIRENRCLLQAGQFCCGPLTVAGCSARCPSLGVACIGCRGPARDANIPSAVALLEEKGFDRPEIARRLTTFAPVAVGREIAALDPPADDTLDDAAEALELVEVTA
jgi:coenzyme F420-reducing hydrogenase gamma subunit